ncbi:MFS transporter [Nonomuraea sp. NPDC049784]|uniref:MFS transporter n=1 Tax=Nonomuraea sp. NPDC049784 TaxID=3154361 RepID=UPI0033DA9F4E
MTPEARLSRPVALLVAGTFFMENLDGTIISTAAPAMARSLGVMSSDIGVCVTAYLLTLAVLIPVSGHVADRWGARRTFLAAIVVFTAASALCAASTNLTELLVMRVLQAVGGAMMVPVGRLVVLRTTSKQEMITAIAYLTWPALVAPIVAPMLGGLLVSYASWHWIFLLNVPLGVMAVVVGARVMPRLPGVACPPFDTWGALLSAATLGCLVYAATLVGAQRVPWSIVALFVAACCGAAVVAVRHLRRTAHPLLDLGALNIQTFRVSHAGGSLFRMAVNAVPFLLPLMFQDRFGWSPVKAGAMVLFVFIGNLGIKPLTTPMLRRFGFRTVLIWATSAAVICIAACGVLTVTTPLAITAVVVLLGGVFRSIGFTVYNTIAFADVDQSDMSRANTLAGTIQQLAQGLGVAVGVLALQAGVHTVGTSDSYPFAFVAVALLIVVAVIEAVRLPHSAGESIGGGAAR